MPKQWRQAMQVLTSEEQDITPEMITSGVIKPGVKVTATKALYNTYTNNQIVLADKQYQVIGVSPYQGQPAIQIQSESGTYSLHWGDAGGAQYFKMAVADTPEEQAYMNYEEKYFDYGLAIIKALMAEPSYQLYRLDLVKVISWNILQKGNKIQTVNQSEDINTISKVRQYINNAMVQLLQLGYIHIAPIRTKDGRAGKEVVSLTAPGLQYAQSKYQYQSSKPLKWID